MQRLYVVLPDGQVVTRQTHRDYKWVVAIKRQDGIWQAWRWTQSDKLVQQVRRSEERSGIYAEVRLIPVQYLSGSSRRHSGRAGLSTRRGRAYILSFHVSPLELTHTPDEEIEKIARHLGAERWCIDRELNAVTLFSGKGWRAPWATIEQAKTFGWKEYQSKGQGG